MRLRIETDALPRSSTSPRRRITPLLVALPGKIAYWLLTPRRLPEIVDDHIRRDIGLDR